jgi:hypothetical protein
VGQTNFLAIFGTFGRYVTNPRGTFVENVKKSPKSTHPTLVGLTIFLLFLVLLEGK